MEIDDVSKIVLISDTHMHISESAIEAVFGAYDNDQIYESVIITEDPKLASEYRSIKNQINVVKPKLIIHAGDIGYQNIIDALEEAAPVIAVVGNCDFQTFRTKNGETKKFEYFDFEGVKIAVAHIPYDLDAYINGNFFKKAKISKDAIPPALKIHGHTHESKIILNSPDDVTICPGSATMGRYGTPNSIACVYIYQSILLGADLIEV